MRSLSEKGVIRRLEGGHGRGDVTTYSLSQGRVSNSSVAGIDEILGRVSKRVSEKGVKRVSSSRAPDKGFSLEVQVLEVPKTLEEHPPGVPPQPTAQTVVAQFIDQANAANVIVPRRTIGHLAKQIKDLLDEGFTPKLVGAGLTLMIGKGKIIPSSLPNFVLEAQLPVRPTPNPRAMRYGRGWTADQILANQGRPIVQ